MTRVPYKSIDLKSPCRVFNGRTRVTSVEAVTGTRLFRVVDGPLDFFVVEGPNVVAGIEIEASNVAAGVREAAPALRGRGGKAKDDEDA